MSTTCKVKMAITHGKEEIHSLKHVRFFALSLRPPSFGQQSFDWLSLTLRRFEEQVGGAAVLTGLTQ